MSSEKFDQRETFGVAAALDRCRTLVAQIENALARDIPLRDNASLAEVHAALNHAEEPLNSESLKKLARQVCHSGLPPFRAVFFELLSA
jgi:hypothetical protein